MRDSSQPAKRRCYDAAFRAEALYLAAESRSTQAAARALNIDPKRLCKWQKEALTPVAGVLRGGRLALAMATYWLCRQTAAFGLGNNQFS
ncbi:MAG: transposase [Janthinobacterium lividum]